MKAPSPYWCGTAAEVGAAQRKIWETAWKQGRAGRSHDRERVRSLKALLEAFAPEWLVEAEAFAGEHLESYLNDQCPVLHPAPAIPTEANCSAILALGRATSDGFPLLL